MKVLCVGSNYARHVREMGTTAGPVWFWKPETAIVADGEPVVLPDVGEVHHEVELAVRIGREARRAAPDEALACLDAFTVAVDVTARGLQREAKRAGRPWAQAKGYDTFLPLGDPVPWDPAGPDLQDLRLRLCVDGEVRQDAATAGMTWGVDRLVAQASGWTTLRPGDWLLTGTPEGVGPLRAGQQMVAEAVGHVQVANPVVAESGPGRR